MISISILKALEEAGFGTIDVDLFLENAPLNSSGKPKNGLWIVTRGSGISRLNTEIQSFDIYSRYANKLTGHQKLDSVLEWLRESYSDVCDLPAVPPHTTQAYNNVRIFPSSSVENVGVDENGLVVRVISFDCYFNKE